MHPARLLYELCVGARLDGAFLVEQGEEPHHRLGVDQVEALLVADERKGRGRGRVGVGVGVGVS